MSRFLFIAAVGAPSSLSTDGSTVLVMNIVRDLCTAGHYCYVVFPEGCDLSVLPVFDRTMYLTSDFPVHVLDAQSWCVDQPYIFNLFSIAMGKYMIDAVVVLHGAQVIPIMQTIGYMGREARPIVFVVEQGTNWITTQSGYRVGATDEQWQVLGASHATLLVVSEFDRCNWEDKARAYDLSPRRLDYLLSHIRVASAPTNVGLLQSIAQSDVQRYTTPTCLWAARTNATKSPEVVVSIFDEVYKRGENVQVKYLSQTSDMKATVMAAKRHIFDERQHIEVKYDATPNDFYTEARKSHVYVCWSHSESYNVSVVEATILGCVFLCKDSQAFRSLYPFGLGGEQYWLASPEDAVDKVSWVLKNYEQAYAEQQGFRDTLLHQQTKMRVADILVEEVINHYTNVLVEEGCYEFKVATGVGRMMHEVSMGLPDEFSLDDVLIGLSNVCNNFNLSNSRRYTFRKVPPNWCIHQLLQRDCHVIDMCTKRNPIYRKLSK